MASQPKTNLPPHSRFITTHNADGKAVFSTAVPEKLEDLQFGSGKAFGSLPYTTTGLPVSMTSNKDLETYQNFLTAAPGLVEANTTLFRTFDMGPGNSPLMHRTESLDVGVVLEGEVELLLDSGETRVLKRGDIAVQRGTNHAWRNPSDTEWARVFFVMQPSEKVIVGGKELHQELSALPLQ